LYVVAAECQGGAVIIAASKKPIRPALFALGEARSVQNRIADSITIFAGTFRHPSLGIRTLKAPVVHVEADRAQSLGVRFD
jgi:hypothetical protein